MKQLWSRFETWTRINAPHLLDQINPGASQSDIDNLETLIEKKLPQDFVEFYKVHDGQDLSRKGREGFINAEELLPISGIINNWKLFAKVRSSIEDLGWSVPPASNKRIRNDWLNPAWIPFTQDGSGSFTCIDLDPSSIGKYGQVIRYWHESSPELFADSFSEYISDYIEGLEKGKYVYAKDWGLVDKESPFNQP